MSKAEPPPGVSDRFGHAAFKAMRSTSQDLDGLRQLLQNAFGRGCAALGALGPCVDGFIKTSARMLESYCYIDLHRFARGPNKPPLHGCLPMLFVSQILSF